MFEEGKNVRWKNNPSKTGVLCGEPRPSGPRTYWRVRLPNGKTDTVPEDQLELFEINEIEDLPTLIEHNRFSSLKDVRQIITQTRINGNLSDIIYSMDATNTEFFAYQFKPVCKIINSPSNAVLIADEVGLGKTIEAGLIWTELKQRYDYKRLLIVCPKVLSEKWRTELNKKIGVKAEIVTAKDMVDRIQKDDEYALICSVQSIASEKMNEKLEEVANREDILIDLLIIDEAHYLRNSETKANHSATFLRELSDYAVFLSATPIQNKNEDLFSLIHILDKDNFQYKENFEIMLECNRSLVRLRRDILSYKMDKNEIINRLIEIKENDLIGFLGGSRQLEYLIETLKKYKTEDIDLKTYQKIAYELDEINTIGYIYNRTRKRDVQEYRTVREAVPETIEMTEAERELYEKVTECIHRYAIQSIESRPGFALFLLCQPQRMLSSSLFSTYKYWKSRSEGYGYDDADSDTEDNEVPSDFMNAIYDEIESFNQADELYENDTKYNRLLEIIKKMDRDHPDDKIVLFSSFIPTLEYLSDRLSKDGIHGLLLTGKVNEKDEILTEFETNKKIKILLASEVGSEGVDLQFCRLLINYDLPWNPMRIEQRIGRLDRIGQKADKILIWNLFHDSTIDKRVYDKLYNKLEICTSALGDFEVVLGDVVKKLSMDLLQLSEKEQVDRIEQTERAIVNIKNDNERLEENASILSAYGNYILDKIQSETNKITARDLSVYVLGSLKKFYPETNSHKISEETEYEYEMSLPDNFLFDFEDFCGRYGYGKNNKLLRDYKNIRFCFTNKIKRASKNTEIINQIHPLIKFLKEKIKSENEHINPTAAVYLSDSTFEKKGTYLLGATFVSAEGVSRYAKIVYSGINAADGTFLSEEDAEKLLSEAVEKGRDWIDRKGLDYHQLSEKAFDVVIRNIEIYDDNIKKFENKNIDRAEIQIKMLNKHRKDKEKKLENVIFKLKKGGHENLIPAQKAIYGKEFSTIDSKIVRLEARKNLKNPTKEDISLIVVKVD